MLFKREKIWPYLQLMRWDKPTGLLLLLWPTLWALWSASRGGVPIFIFFIFVFGVVGTRTAGCVINDLADRKFDGLVERTKLRPLAAKAMSVQQAVSVLLMLGLINLMLVLNLNEYSVWLAVGGACLAALYPLLKRFIQWPQIGLGVVFNWGILMAYAAMQNYIPLTAWLLYGCGICWTVAYDTIYALVDKEDDLKIGINSTAIAWGKWTHSVIGSLYGLFYVGLVVFGIIEHFSWPFFSFIMLSLGLSLRTLSLLRFKDRLKYWQAFKQCHYEGALIFLEIFSHYFLAVKI